MYLQADICYMVAVCLLKLRRSFVYGTALHGRTDTVGAAMANEITEAAIAKLERSIEELEGKIRALRTAINTMCVDDGLPPRYPDAALVSGGGPRLSQIQDDTFYGKKQTPAMREYLEMRRAQG